MTSRGSTSFHSREFRRTRRIVLAGSPQYELAYRMQIAVPELMDPGRRTSARLRPVRTRTRAHARHVSPRTACSPAPPGGNAAGAGSSSSSTEGGTSTRPLPEQNRPASAATPSTRPPAALVVDPPAGGGLLDDTLVVWGGECSAARCTARGS